MKRQATISIEPLHLYGIWTSNLETILQGSKTPAADMRDHATKIISDGLTTVIPFLKDIVTGYCRRLNYQIQICFLIDDKFCHWGEITSTFTVEDAAETISSTWSELTCNISELGSLFPLIIRESDLDDPARWLLERMLAAPVEGQGSQGQLPRKDSLVANYRDSVYGEKGTPGVPNGSDFAPFLGEADLHQDIRLSCQLYTVSDANSDLVSPTCTLLAATWQLCRLGQIPADRLPRSICSSVAAEEVPWTSAIRTFSILPMSLIAVEHGVRLIISQYMGHSTTFLSEDDIRNQIAYLFLPDGWLAN